MRYIREYGAVTRRESSAPPGAGAMTPGGRVLLVDDDDAFRAAYARLIHGLGHEVETAASGPQALSLMDGRGFDLVVSDIGMPEMDGVEFLRRVRQKDADVPLILVTGAPTFDTAVRSIEHGVFRYFTKPVDRATFGEAIRRALSLHRLARLKREALEATGFATGATDRAALLRAFDDALPRIWMAFQPIVSVRERRAVAYEALMRPGDASFPGPAEILAAAERLGCLPRLGHVLRRLVAAAGVATPGDALLFVNVHPSDLDDEDLYDPGAPLSGLAARVVLEITERASVEHVPDLDRRIERLRGLGFRLAVDDLGAGYAGLTTLTRLAPEFVKLDAALIDGVHASAQKQSIVRAIVPLCRDELAMQVIAEGVERDADRTTLESLGCDLLQGFLFARPGPPFPEPRFEMSTA